MRNTNPLIYKETFKCNTYDIIYKLHLSNEHVYYSITHYKFNHLKKPSNKIHIASFFNEKKIIIKKQLRLNFYCCWYGVTTNPRAVTTCNDNWTHNAPQMHRPVNWFSLTFAKLAWPGVIFPFSYNLQRRQPTKIIAWTLPNIRISFSWLIWNAANGAPNCFLSFKYLTTT